MADSSKHQGSPKTGLVLAWVALWCMVWAMMPFAQAETPWWSQTLPHAVARGGSSGTACQVMPLSATLALLPSHCPVLGSPSQKLDISSGSYPLAGGKDYRFSEATSLAGPYLDASWVAKSRPSAGDIVWVQKSTGWSRARVELPSGSGYWLGALGEPFCPGDSGSAVWGSFGSHPVWLGMVVSGEEGSGCSQRATALASGSIDWPWAR